MTAEDRLRKIGYQKTGYVTSVKQDAQTRADELRSKGNLARVTKTRRGLLWIVWTKQKPA